MPPTAAIAEIAPAVFRKSLREQNFLSISHASYT
jgi:hypothetical protein